MQQQDIFDQLVSQKWLYERVFGKLLNDLVFDQEVEARKSILKNVFNFRDVDMVFKKEIERGNFHDLTKMVFRYYETPENPNLISQIQNNGNNQTK